MSSRKTKSKRGRQQAAYALAVLSDVSGRASQRVATGGRTLGGDRWVEWGFCVSRIPTEPGQVLDFGADIGFLSFAAAERGHDVVAFDRMDAVLEYEHPSVRTLQGDILTHDFGDARFDLILNCSTVEHVGLAGRYGSFDREDGDLEAMKVLRGLLKPQGQMVLTVPVGQDGVFAPNHRVYGEQRLPRLLDGYTISEEQFWQKQDRHWTKVDRGAALAEEATERFYALGLFVLAAP
jgi:SAM-dependent methyltransferase